MNQITRVVKIVCPGGRRSARRGFGLVFAVFFYVYAAVVALRGPELVRLWTDGGWLDAILVLAGLALLYIGSTAVVAVFRDAGDRGKGRGGMGFSRRFRATPMAVTGFCLFLALVCCAVLAPLLAVSDPVAQDSPSLTRYQEPSADHPMGTDKFGRDVWSRVLFGARASLSIGVISVALAVLLGLVVGVAAGYAGGIVDDILMRVVDGLLAFPRLLLVLTLVALFSNSFVLLVVVISATGWMGVARLVRGEIIRLKRREFVQAAVATGLGGARVVVRHLLPNSLGPVIVAAALNIGAVILLESYLSFLGLGLEPPAPSWGAMVFDGREVLIEAWWVSAFPALAIVVAVVSCNLMGDGLRGALDTKTGRA